MLAKGDILIMQSWFRQGSVKIAMNQQKKMHSHLNGQRFDSDMITSGRYVAHAVKGELNERSE